MSSLQRSSPCRRTKVSLTPIPNANFYFPSSKQETELISSIEAVEQQVLKVINEVDDKLAYIKANPRKFYSPEPLQIRRSNYKSHLEDLKSRKSPFKLTEKSIEAHLSKLSSRKNSMVRLMQSTNSFNFQKQYKDSLMSKLVKQIDKSKKPCIQGIFSEIVRKESMFEAYKQRKNSQSCSPAFVFSQVCQDEKCAPLPVLAHEQDTCLVLNRYNLNKGVCSALAKAFSLMPYLKSVHLDENGISDVAGAEILKGLVAHGMVTSFFYTHNDIGNSFLQQFEALALQNVLVEINFKACKVGGQVLVDLIWSLRNLVGLRKLTLSELSLSPVSIEKLAKVLEEAKLIYLDISYNSISQEASFILFEGLYVNYYLKFLDYSWNPLSDPDQVKSICKLIRVHPNLTHLNLSHCAMPSSQCLIQAINASETLIGLHLTGNTIDPSKLPNNQLPKLYSNSAVFLDMPTKAVHTYYNLKQRDNNGKLILNHNDSIINTVSPKKNIDKHLIVEPKEVILSRVLSYAELKSAGNWGISEHCWVCQRWGVYRLRVSLDSLNQVATPDIFYSRTITGTKLVMKPSFNNWKDVEFDLVDIEKGEYQVNCLIPPGKHRFLIICDDKSVCVTTRVSTAKWKKLLVNEFTMPLRELEL